MTGETYNDLVVRRIKEYMDYWLTNPNTGEYGVGDMSVEDIRNMIEYIRTGDTKYTSSDWSGYGN